MIKQSDAEKRRIEIMAEAEAGRQVREAQGRAEAAKAEAEASRLRGQAEADVAKARGQAEADVARARGQAEADVVAAKGAAEAHALQVRAEAYAQYNQAAILDRVLESLPAIAQSFADSLAKVDKITIVSTGDGKSAGASALTGEVAKMIAQVPTVVESLTGIDVGELLRKVPGNEGTAKAPASAQTIPVESETV
jgi:flotillin